MRPINQYGHKTLGFGWDYSITIIFGLIEIQNIWKIRKNSKEFNRLLEPIRQLDIIISQNVRRYWDPT